MHRNMTRLGLVLLLSGAAALAITGCKEEGSAEKAGKELDKAAEDAGKQTEQAADDAKKLLEGDD